MASRSPAGKAWVRAGSGAIALRGGCTPAIGLAVLLAIVLAAAPARAVIEGSPHDLISQGYDVVKASPLQERCSRCHVSASPASQELLAEVPPVLEAVYGSPSLLCFSCHDGTTIVSPDVDASRTAFHPASHGNDLGGYEGLSGESTGLPYLTGRRMECVTCHDPHDNGHRPFLRDDLQEICLACHAQYVEFSLGKENRSGNHVLAKDPDAAPRAGVPLKAADAFRTAFPSPYPLARGKGSGGWHWNLGGHLHKGSTGETSCVTCHAVHGDETSPPSPSLLALEPVNDVANEFCEGCHRGERGDHRISRSAPNPGDTTTARTYHPCDDDVGNGEGRLPEVAIPEGWPLGGGSPRRLLCSTCHRPHNAQVETQLLRPVPEGESFCMQCHDGMLLEYHHPTGTTQGKCAQNSLGVGTTAELGCEKCHKAHNAGLGAADERLFVPILRETYLSDTLCSTCHTPGNPTCGTSAGHMSSHFLGDPGLDTTYSDLQPPLRIEPWPESGLLSLYGGEKSKSVICLSCHRFQPGAMVSGDGGTGRFLVAKAGNPVEWEDGDEAKYLCTGCHGTRPGTGTGSKGHTHPLMKADILALGLPVLSPAASTPNGHVNCDSCHRSHEAATAGGVFIMEAVTGTNTDPMAIQPPIDFTPTCHLCHDASKY